MQIAFHSVQFSPMFGGTTRLVDVLSAAQSAGFRNVGLDTASIRAFVESGGRVDEIRREFDTRQLCCTDLVYLALEPDRSAVMAAAQHLAELADVLSPTLCVVAVTEAMEHAAVVRLARSCATILGKRGMRLAVEYAPYAALSDLERSWRLCDAIGWDRAGILLDSLHFFRSGTKWDELAALDGAEIAMVQFSDAPATRPNDLVDESRNHRLIPGDGELALARFVTAVRNTGYDGLVSTEVLSASLRTSDPVRAARRLHDSLSAYWLENVEL